MAQKGLPRGGKSKQRPGKEACSEIREDKGLEHLSGKSMR